MKNKKRKRSAGMVGRISVTRSLNMSAIKARNTVPEIILRKALFRNGLRFRLHAPSLPGRPDIVFPREKIAVFCDGDFWHGRNWRQRMAAGQFRVRRAYWTAKIENNMKRDKRNNRALRKMGWAVLRFWETDLKKDVDKATGKVAAVVKARRAEF
jgi:DNA mismatch endonuclease (patch repair protein)